jgi:hypothetical protein
MPRNVIAKYLGPEQFEQLDKQKESRLRSGVRAVKRLIRLGDDSIVVRGVDDLDGDARALLQSASWRRDHWLRHARQGRGRAHQALQERDAVDGQSRAHRRS